ncbi:hypothetical protein ABZ532_29445 [Streptomyces sp. NPDC019396]|uniref:hypothetical protein n=1 Tax=Streptomyces sp. NPDC019396 TaxID=3154687 RepID=UPI0033DDEFB1
MPEFPSLAALDRLLGDLVVGEARRRQLGIVRGELGRALARGPLPTTARRSLRRLLEEEALAPYQRLAESGALRARQMAGGYPPTSEATNEARAQCLDLLRGAYGLPPLQLGAGGRMPLRPTPDSGTLVALRRQLDQDLGGAMSPGRTRSSAGPTTRTPAPPSATTSAKNSSTTAPATVSEPTSPARCSTEQRGDQELIRNIDAQRGPGEPCPLCGRPKPDLG